MNSAVIALMTKCDVVQSRNLYFLVMRFFNVAERSTAFPGPRADNATTDPTRYAHRPRIAKTFDVAQVGGACRFCTPEQTGFHAPVRISPYPVDGPAFQDLRQMM